jgi:hypothetical protein
MFPSDLKPDHFRDYPPLARQLVTANLTALSRLPLSFLPSLLREAIEYDFKFPAERKAVEKEIANLSSLSSEEFKKWFGDFEQIRLSQALERFDWVNSPGQFVEQLSAHLWTTHQLDAFRNAATEYGNRLHAVAPPEPPAIPRLGITIIGQGTASSPEPLFRKLRPHGAYFSRVSSENGLQQLLAAAAARATAHRIPYAHWYIDGGKEALSSDTSSLGFLTRVSYDALEPARVALSGKMQREIEKPGMGPETLRTLLAQLKPADLGLNKGEPVLTRFQLKLLTEGSGTQIFSTTFAQWAAREALRRAQPLTLFVRFAPRQRQRPMNELLYGKTAIEMDPTGSLLDADMGAYYNWLNQQRLSGASQASFLVWYEGHGEALMIGPSVPRGTVSNDKTDFKTLLNWIA